VRVVLLLLTLVKMTTCPSSLRALRRKEMYSSLRCGIDSRPSPRPRTSTQICAISSTITCGFHHHQHQHHHHHHHHDSYMILLLLLLIVFITTTTVTPLAPTVCNLCLTFCCGTT
jgi:hypothetical protein